MEIEHLSKSQIILLTLLISFVTSIATGIVTVSLMDQAPPAIAQTVNRVVEHTVEKVVQSAAVAAPAQTQTVVVRESDLVAAAVQNITPSIVQIYGGEGADATFLGLGEVIDKNGSVATDAGSLGDATSVTLVLSNGAHVHSTLSSADDVSGIAFMKTATSTVDGKPITWQPVALAGKPTLGQTAVAISGKTIQRIENGIITALIPLDKGGPVLDTNIAQDHILPGAPLIDTDGNVLGVSTSVSRASSPSGFIQIALSAPAAPANSEKNSTK